MIYKILKIFKETKEVEYSEENSIGSNGQELKTINEAEKAEREALHSLAKTESITLNEFANMLNKRSSRIVNLITSLGQDRRAPTEKTASPATTLAADPPDDPPGSL